MAEHKHITAPDPFGFQVRIVRRGVEHSRYFSHKLWGGKKKSLKAAIRWRDQMLTVLKGSQSRFMKTRAIKLQPVSQESLAPLNTTSVKTKVICVIRSFGSKTAV
jgi:hypothetical protein